MKYVALFLDGDSYIEKCLLLIKYICAPGSKTAPHITLRLFKEDDDRINNIIHQNITHLNIIEPGAFNIQGKAKNEHNRNNAKPYIVFLKCESDQLEGIDYRPDYPFSRLHITLYEGDDIKFTKSLLSLLKSFPWNLTILFEPAKHLTDQILGTKTTSFNAAHFTELFDDLCIHSPEVLFDNLSTEKKLDLIHSILSCMDLFRNNNKSSYADSLYSDTEIAFDSSGIPVSTQFIDYSNTIDSALVKEKIDDLSNNIQEYFVTPPEYADEMAFCALEELTSESVIDFGDSAVGGGALFLAFKRLIDSQIDSHASTKQIIHSAIGIDNDKKMALEAYLRCKKRGLVVYYGDALSPQMNLEEQRNLMMVNPPYNRHEEIPVSYKKKIRDLAQKQTGIVVPQKAGLYVYHLLIMDRWLKQNGIAVWLLPSAFLQTQYGGAVRKYLTENVRLLRVHQYDERATQFDNAMVSTTIVVFRKEHPQISDLVTFSFGKSAKKPKHMQKVTIEDISNCSNWNQLTVFEMKNINRQNSASHTTIFSDLFEIKRGIATGANSFFVVDRKKAAEIGIPSFALKPILPKSRYLQGNIIHTDKDGYPLVKPQLSLIDCDMEESDIKSQYPSFYAYLQKAKETDSNGQAIIDRTLIKTRKLWYKQEERDPPLFLLTYMGRKKDGGSYLSFFLNESAAIALNTYIMLYPKPWLCKLLQNDKALTEQLFLSLNKTANTILSEIGRVYSGGLRKVEPTELKTAKLIELPTIITDSIPAKN